nr:hypothetical protein [Tanacetum cinerariifolium]
MDNPNISIEEYIRLEEDKARQHGKVYSWETARYGDIWYDADIHDLRSIEIEFPAIVFNDELSSKKALSCEPMVSSLNNNEIDIRISFGESNVKITCYFDDLDFLKDLENEFPTIVYNDVLTFKSESSTEPVEILHRIDEFDLKTKTSLPEQKDNDDEIDTVKSSGDMALSVRDQRHQYIRGLTDLMAEGLSGKMLMEHMNAQGHNMFISRAWKWLFEIQGPLMHELILEFFSSFRLREAMVDLDTTGALQFQLEGDPILRLCHRLIACSIAERSQAPEKAWVALGLERRSDATNGAPEATRDALTVDEGAPAVPAPAQAP